MIAAGVVGVGAFIVTFGPSLRVENLGISGVVGRLPMAAGEVILEIGGFFAFLFCFLVALMGIMGLPPPRRVVPPRPDLT